MVKKQRAKNGIGKYTPVEEDDGYFYPIEKEIQQISMTAQYILDEIRMAGENIHGTTLPEREQMFKYLCNTLERDSDAISGAISRLKEHLQEDIFDLRMSNQDY